MMEYYGIYPENDFRYYLQHHGVKNQKWGVRNAEWYPIADYQAHLSRNGNSQNRKHNKAKYRICKNLLDELNTKWDYGVLYGGKHVTDTSDFDWSKYRTTPIKTLEKEKCGVCWDFVNYQHYKLKKAGIKDHSYMFTMAKKNGDLVTHTFTIYELNGKKYWIESAMWPKKGIHEVNDYKDVIEQIKDNYKVKDADYSLFEYNPDGMDEGLNDKEYFDKATQNLVYDHKKSVKESVFISGSSKTQDKNSEFYRKELPSEVKKEIDKMIKSGDRINVGDAPGIDRQVQDYLKKKNYNNVQVYGPGKEVRYLANKKWKSNPIDAPEFEPMSAEWLAKKDIQMEKDSDSGLAITVKGGASATRNNIDRLTKNGKSVLVYELDDSNESLDRWLNNDEIMNIKLK